MNIKTYAYQKCKYIVTVEIGNNKVLCTVIEFSPLQPVQQCKVSVAHDYDVNNYEANNLVIQEWRVCALV